MPSRTAVSHFLSDNFAFLPEEVVVQPIKKLTGFFMLSEEIGICLGINRYSKKRIYVYSRHSLVLGNPTVVFLVFKAKKISVTGQ